ncbi:hypothetical protein RJT34_29913 [Clitoria ternatea]|uniref:Uncharacterized protein n=1 Tax=Clitoria ternatea TaxID=43366 RepID=A0AAN9I3K7_CLITE
MDFFAVAKAPAKSPSLAPEPSANASKADKEKPLSPDSSESSQVNAVKDSSGAVKINVYGKNMDSNVKHVDLGIQSFHSRGDDNMEQGGLDGYDLAKPNVSDMGLSDSLNQQDVATVSRSLGHPKFMYVGQCAVGTDNAAMWEQRTSLTTWAHV